MRLAVRCPAASPLTRPRLTEEVLHESVDSRTESLLGLRELGPPDLVHLLKQSPRNQSKQVRSPAPAPRGLADPSSSASTTM